MRGRSRQREWPNLVAATFVMQASLPTKTAVYLKRVNFLWEAMLASRRLQDSIKPTSLPKPGYPTPAWATPGSA